MPFTIGCSPTLGTPVKTLPDLCENKVFGGFVHSERKEITLRAPQFGLSPGLLPTAAVDKSVEQTTPQLCPDFMPSGVNHERDPAISIDEFDTHFQGSALSSSNLREEDPSSLQKSASPFVSTINKVSFQMLAPSSLLFESSAPSSCLFQGDRFIPCRPEDSHRDGAEQFRHEEHMLRHDHLQLPY